MATTYIDLLAGTGRFFRLSPPIEVVSLEPAVWTIRDQSLGLDFACESESDLRAELAECLGFLWDTYALEAKGTLEPRAKALRAELLRRVTVIESVVFKINQARLTLFPGGNSAKSTITIATVAERLLLPFKNRLEAAYGESVSILRGGGHIPMGYNKSLLAVLAEIEQEIEKRPREALVIARILVNEEATKHGLDPTKALEQLQDMPEPGP